MTLPFSADQFFGVFATYNAAIYPAQAGLLVLALAALASALPWRFHSDRFVSGALAALWLWMAVVYHYLHFAAINPAARLFAALFAVEAGILIWKGVVRQRLAFSTAKGVGALLGLTLVGCALVVYPLLGEMLGHRYPATPTFGAPCPTTIFTIGLLVMTTPLRTVTLFVPVAWAAVGATAAFTLGVWQDLGLLAAAGAAVAMAISEGIRRRHGSAR
jgi:hypothetical protein